MKYTKKNDKYIFEKGGVYFALTKKQVRKMYNLCYEILIKQEK